MHYLDILINGEQEEKVELTFRMIDPERKGWFSYDELSQLIISILSAWNDITGTQLSKMFSSAILCNIDLRSCG